MIGRGRTGYVMAAVAGLVGLVWILQGLGVNIGGSFMVGDLRWTAAGLVLVLATAAWATRGVRRTR